MNKKSLDFAKQLAEKDLVSGSIESRSLWADARIRFFRNKASVVSLFIMALIALFALFGGMFAQFSNDEIQWDALGMIAEKGAPSIANGHYFGLDQLGRDLYARVVQGSQISLMVALVSTIISSIIGVALGAIAGFYGGRVDNFIMRIVDIWYGVPYMLVIIVFMAVIGRSTTNLLIAIALISWTSTTIIVRGQVLAIKNREFVDAARVMGVSDFRIIMRHILPNILGIIVINVSLAVPDIIMTESLVSFLGVGVQEPNTSWGALISEGAATMQYGTLWMLAFPAIIFALTQISLYYIGDGLRDAFDPKDR